MGDLREEIPREFSDDERWYRYFTRKSIVVLLLVGVFAVVLVSICSWIGMRVVGIYLAGILGILIMAAVMVPIPEGDALHGSGVTCDCILARMYIRKKTERIYMKSFRNAECEEETE